MAVSKCVNQLETDIEYCLLVFPRKKEDWWFIETKTHLLYFFTLIVYICLKSKIYLLLMCAFKEISFFFFFFFKALVLWRNKEDVIFCFPLTFGILSALKLVIHRCSAKLNCLQSSWEKQNCLQETSVLVLRVCFFFFPYPPWQMLTKVDSKDNPKSKPIVYIHFLKRAILGVLNMKQDQTVK